MTAGDQRDHAGPQRDVERVRGCDRRMMAGGHAQRLALGSPRTPVRAVCAPRRERTRRVAVAHRVRQPAEHRVRLAHLHETVDQQRYVPPKKERRILGDHSPRIFVLALERLEEPVQAIDAVRIVRAQLAGNTRHGRDARQRADLACDGNEFSRRPQRPARSFDRGPEPRAHGRAEQRHADERDDRHRMEGRERKCHDEEWRHENSADHQRFGCVERTIPHGAAAVEDPFALVGAHERRPQGIAARAIAGERANQGTEIRRRSRIARVPAQAPLERPGAGRRHRRVDCAEARLHAEIEP